MSRRLITVCTAAACVAALAGGVPASAAPDRAADRGSSGIGDPYFPLDGNGGIDVKKYSIRDGYDFDKGRLSGRTKLRIQATQNLSSFNLDLLLPVSKVKVNGKNAKHRKPNGHELVITPRKSLEDGDKFSVVVQYAGKPAKYSYVGESNWLADKHEVVAMNEPHMAPWWFPSNDHPQDKATLDIQITVPQGNQVIANGLPKSSRVKRGQITSRWVEKDPMVPYLAFFAAGKFKVAKGTTNGLPWVNAVSKRLPGNGTRGAMSWMKRTPRIVSWLESELGDYPFDSTGGLVTSLNPGFALENQTRPTYPWFGKNNWLLVHELAHQWFGDSVSVQNWRDIWLNEGFASYMEQRYVETHGGRSADSWLRQTHGFIPANDSFWQLEVADPGARKIFFGAIYDRGAMTLVALRNVIGDDAFAQLLKDWAAQHAYGNAETADFITLAEEASGRDLTAFFDAWLVSPTKPANTAANGLG